MLQDAGEQGVLGSGIIGLNHSGLSTAIRLRWGVLQDKDLFFCLKLILPCWFALFCRARLIPTHPALVNAIVLVLHSVAGSTPLPTPETSSRSMPSSSYRDMPGGFLFEEGLSGRPKMTPSTRAQGQLHFPAAHPAPPASLRLHWGSRTDPSPRVNWLSALALALARPFFSGLRRPCPPSVPARRHAFITNHLLPAQALQHYAPTGFGQPLVICRAQVAAAQAAGAERHGHPRFRQPVPASEPCRIKMLKNGFKNQSGARTAVYDYLVLLLEEE
uniref:Uncharacterized protein n=1 Tax=Sphaerodactylus townsendi TaxID=933632 RepID=A0ACB8E5S0_9SAUR